MMQISEMDHGLTTWMSNTANLGWPSYCHIPYVRTKGQTFVSATAAVEFLGIPGCIQHLEHHLECTDLNQAFREKGSKKQDLISLEAFILLVFGGIPSCKILQKNSLKVENIKKLRLYFLDKIAPDLARPYRYCDNSRSFIAEESPCSTQTVTNMEQPGKMSAGCSSVGEGVIVQGYEPLRTSVPRVIDCPSTSNASPSYLLNLQRPELKMNNSATTLTGPAQDGPKLVNGVQNLPDSKQNVKMETGPFECEYCHMVFLQKRDLNLHKICHKPRKVYYCKYCGKAFHHSTNLTIHLRVHTGEKPFHCKECPKTFSHSSNLRQHLRTHTQEKPFECDFCKKSFASSSQLKSHIRVHTEEKPHRCRQCGKVFAQSSQLQSHMITHSVERQYPCQYCGKVFKQSGNRNQHLRTHTGSKPFQCEFCDKTFAWSSSYKNHLQSHKIVQINIPEGTGRAQNEQFQDSEGVEMEEKQFSFREDQTQGGHSSEPTNQTFPEPSITEQVQVENVNENEEQPSCYRIELDPVDEEMLTVVIPTPLVMVNTE